MIKRLFVISPIGEEDSEKRRHADAVLDKIIGAAVDLIRNDPDQAPKINLQVVRGERDPNAGRIHSQIIKAILEFEILCVILFENNGNVFYEAGVGHAAGRPLLLLGHADYDIPFDLRDHRAIPYTDADLNDPVRAGRSGGPVAALVSQIRDLLGKPLFRDPFELKDVGAFGELRVLDRFSHLKYEDWSSILLDAEKEIWLAGVSLWELINPINRKFFRPVDPTQGLPKASNANIADLLAYAMQRGVDVNVLIMHPQNPALPEMLLRPPGPFADPAETFAIVVDEINNSFARFVLVKQRILDAAKSEKWAETHSPPGTMRITRVRSGLIPQRVTLTDREAVTTPFFDSIQYNSGGPAVRCRADASWHRLFRDQLQLLLDHNRAEQDSSIEVRTG